MSLATVIAISALIQGVLLPQTAPPSIEDVIHRYEKGLRKIAGVKEIVSEKAGGVATITIRVETEESRDMARFMTGEALESYPVRILVSKLQLPAGPEAAGPAGSVSAEEANCPHCPIHCPLPRSPRTETAPINPPTVGTPKTDDGKSPETTKASRPSIEDVIHSYEKGLRRIEGVREIYPDQVGGVATITVRVETAEARDTVQFMIGEKLGGYPVRMLLSTTPLSGRPDSVSPEGRSPSEEASCIHCPLHCPLPSAHRTEVEAPQTAPAATA
ncbi:MAG TPA: hypothetical protein VKU80_09640, partial [Planctomycetota bacterium]|nr:hypothetical protein [Planctomycetota bacterium]